MEKKKLKDKMSFIRAAIPKVAAAYFKRVTGLIPSKEEQKFREEQCLNCFLFNRKEGVCDKTIFVNEETTPISVISIESVENNEDIYRQLKDEHGVTRRIVWKNKVLTRGCGCSLTGASAKWKFHFTEEDLAKTDGTAPCPLTKWSKENFINWKNNNDE